MDPSANENFTRGKSALVVVVNGLSDPKTGHDRLTVSRYDGCHVSVTLDEITSMMHDLSSWKWNTSTTTQV